jgi:hypothetical protein
MRIAQLCIAVAAAVLCGFWLAPLAMRHEAALIAAQPYLNLLGWASMGLYGIYYCSPGPVLRPRLAWTQAGAATVGFAAITGGLAALAATGDARFAAVAALGLLAALLAMALFAAQLLIAGATTGKPLPPPRYS